MVQVVAQKANETKKEWKCELLLRKLYPDDPEVRIKLIKIVNLNVYHIIKRQNKSASQGQLYEGFEPSRSADIAWIQTRL